MEIKNNDKDSFGLGAFWGKCAKDVHS